jgi:hypothetical protein
MSTVLSTANLELILSKISCTIPRAGVSFRFVGNTVRIVKPGRIDGMQYISQADLHALCVAADLTCVVEKLPDDSAEKLAAYAAHCRAKSAEMHGKLRPARIPLREEACPPSGYYVESVRQFDILVLSLMRPAVCVDDMILGRSHSGLMVRWRDMMLPLDARISHKNIRLHTCTDQVGDTLTISLAICVDRFTRYAQVIITPRDVCIWATPVAIYPTEILSCLAGYAGVIV